MMATTHVLAGLSIASVVAAVAPEFTPVAVVAAVLGGAAPDFDLYAGHRKTLHYPVYLPAMGVLATPAALVFPNSATIGVAVFLLAAGLHSAMDAWGGGLELKPWAGTSEQAVFSHFHGAWLAPRRFVRYDGAPEDLLLAGVLAIPAFLAFGSPVEELIVGILVVSGVYTLLRKPMVWAGEWAVERLPQGVVGRIPDRFVGDLVDSVGQDGAAR